jgi:RimJ/RimL family protein N-acetyltransferase
LRVKHAEEMADLLDDLSLHEFIGGEPETVDQLRSPYLRLVSGESPDGQEGWMNWIVRDRESAAAVGTIQAGIRDTGAVMSAELAWVIATRYQRLGYATEAVRGVMASLSERGARLFIAHIHPEHAASMSVARHLGLEPTDVSKDGETRWVRVDH